MRQHQRTFSLFLLLALILSCATVPITGRETLAFIPAGTILPGFDNYRDFLAQHKVIDQASEAQLVARVGQRVQHSVERYFPSAVWRSSKCQWNFTLWKARK
jgi:hypothetical protein